MAWHNMRDGPRAALAQLEAQGLMLTALFSRIFGRFRCSWLMAQGHVFVHAM